MKNYYVIFYDKSHIVVDQEQAFKISDLMVGDKPRNFEHNGNVYSSSSISKILSEREYQEQYPDKEIGPIFKNQFKQLPEYIDYHHETIEEQAKRTNRGWEQLIRGLECYIEENPDHCENAKELLKRKKEEHTLKTASI